MSDSPGASPAAPVTSSPSFLHIGVVAGEASGDLLGAALIGELRRRVPELRVTGIGGPRMLAAGMDSLYPLERLSVMGYVEPLKRLPELLRIRRDLRKTMLEQRPAVFLGIDAPDFNLKLEQDLRTAGLRTAHLVSPTVWAWRQRRIHRIARAVDLMLTVFPFETAIYEEHQVPVRFVGHPLADDIPLEVDTVAAREALKLATGGQVVALLPGSRGGEVQHLGSRFLATAAALHAKDSRLRFLLPAANAERYEQMQALLADWPQLPVTLLQGDARTALSAADVVLVASGTATLETLLLKKPMVIAYHMSSLSWALVSRLVRVPYVGMPNILAGEALVPEFLQQAAQPAAMAEAVAHLLGSQQARDTQCRAYERMHRELRLNSAERSATALLELATGGQ